MNLKEARAIDMAHAQAFADRVGGLMDSGAATVMISIGHRLGLLDHLAELTGGAPSIQLAEASGCFERHVREWLAVMVVAGVIEYEPGARRYPQSRFTGYDLCTDAIEDAQAAASAMSLSNVRLVVRDLTGYVEAERRDLVTSFDAVHDQKDPLGLIQDIHASIRPGGIYLMQDIGASADLENNRNLPCATLLYAISTMHCTPVSIGQIGQGLGTMWSWETAERYLLEAGFALVERHVLAHAPMNVWFVSRVSP